MLVSSYRLLPDLPGVYIFKNKKGKILYVGKAINIKDRVSSYFRNTSHLGEKTRLLVESVFEIDSIVVASEIEALLLEANLIKKHIPTFNVRWTDGKAYPFIKIAVINSYPSVIQSRHIDDPKALYFGPYPNIGDVRKILKLVRRIFPFVSVKNHPKKICLYYHLGLCPCPQVFDSGETQRFYRRNIRYLVRFLEGKKHLLVKGLEKRMRKAAKRESFEEASNIKKQIDTIHLITRPFRTPAEYIVNPNLLEDEAAKTLLRLKEVLAKEEIQVSMLRRIECYDISNISGKYGSGSMVVATNGILDKSQYRHFRIRVKNTPNDVLMLSEVLSRRVEHKEWNAANLIVVDGGIAQVNAVSAVLKQANLKIPVIGLAKRQEEIYFSGNKRVKLPRGDRALGFLQTLRDEAHRFALSYHRKLRRKHLFTE